MATTVKVEGRESREDGDEVEIAGRTCDSHVDVQEGKCPTFPNVEVPESTKLPPQLSATDDRRHREMIARTANQEHQAFRQTRITCSKNRPGDITHRGVDLPTACVTGDLPLVAMLLAEGADNGVNMLSADQVRYNTYRTSYFRLFGYFLTIYPSELNPFVAGQQCTAAVSRTHSNSSRMALGQRRT